ncbi:MAG TPA: ATP-binding cassette domain-containing protein [Dissulfurispiraceae bacterium]|nr:ATP-binding cassette domain-containing protein [Dissulfurispiraceae bacterium]
MSTVLKSEEPHIVVNDLTISYGNTVIQQDLSFVINRGDIFIIMGRSGSGKSTLFRSMIGLMRPAKGQVLYDGVSLWDAEPEERKIMMRKFGVLYQGGALWSSYTLAENVALPLQEWTDLNPRRIQEIVSFNLSLVGLSGFEDYYPAEISGGMKKRAGLARALALDPDILFFDEPSAGLDPVSAHLLDELLIELSTSLGATIIVVTHELASLFAIGNNAIFLDDETRTMIAMGHPKELLATSKDLRVTNFLTRGEGKPGRT